MTGKSFSVSFNISGSLDGSLQAALANAANAMRGLGNAARGASANAKASMSGLQGLASSLNNLQNAATKYKALQESLKQVTPDLGKAGQALESAKAKFDADAKAVDNLKQKLSSLKQELSKAKQKKLVQSEGVKVATADLKALKRAYDAAKLSGDKMRMSELSAQIEHVQAALSRQRQTAQEAARAYGELSNKIKQTKADLKAAESAAKDSNKDLNRARQDAERLKQSYLDQLSALGRLKATLSAAGFNVSSFAASEERLQADINRVNAALERQAALLRAQQQSAQASQDMFNAYNNFQNSLQTAETIASPFKSAVDKAVEFERVMSEVKALTQMDNIAAGRFDAVEREMSSLTKQAKELGATTIYTAKEVGEAQAYIARTGWSTDQILGSTPIFLKLAASQHMDISRTADIATNIMTAFGHNMAAVGNDADKFAKMIQHDADVFAYTVTHSNQTFEQFGEAMKYAAPVAKNFGATIEETAMMTKFMADAGIQGSMAGTSMRQTMLRLTAPPKKATKAMEQYGITLDDANAAWLNANAVAQVYGATLHENLTPGRQFISIMEQIDKNMAGASDREKLAALAAITGINAVSGAANLFGAGANQARNFTELLEQCDGALEQTYAVMTDNTFGAQKSFESAWEAVQLSVGEALNGIARAGYGIFAPMLTSLSQFIDANPQVVQACAAIAAGLATIVVAAAAVQLAFAGWKFITSTILMVQEVLASLGSGAMLGGLIGRLALLKTLLVGTATMSGFATFGGWSTLFIVLSTNAKIAATAIRGFFASLTVGSVVNGAIGGLKALGMAIAGVTKAAFSFAFSPVGVALMLIGAAGYYAYTHWDRVAPVLERIGGIITGALSPAIEQVKAAIDGLTSSGGFESLCNSASSLANIVGGTVVKAFMVLLTIAASVIAELIQLFADLLTIIFDFGTGLADAFAKIKNGEILGAFDELGKAGKKVSADITKMGDHAFDGFVQGAKNVKSVLDALEMPKLPTQKVSRRHAVHFDENGQAHEAVAPAPSQPQPQSSTPTPTAAEVPQLDTTATQSALDAVGQSAQNASTNMQGLNQAQEMLSQFPASLEPARTALSEFPQSLEPAKTALSEFPTALQPTIDAMSQIGEKIQPLGDKAQVASGYVETLGTNAQLAGEAMSQVPGHATALNAALDLPIGNLEALGVAAGNSVGNIDAMSTAAGNVASALASKAAEISNIHISVPTVSVGGTVAANYEGGIYRKGAFLTTFAERSAEAAIPLDKSRRAQDLWTQAGQILGLLPDNEPIHYEGSRNLDETEFPKGQSLPRRESQRVGRPRRETSTKLRATSTKLPKLPKMPYLFTQTQPRYYDSLSNIFGGTNQTSNSYSISNLPKIFTQTQPTTYNTIGSLAGDMPNEIITTQGSDGLIGSLVGQIIPQPITESAPTINLTVNVTVNGGGGTVESDVRRGVESALPAVEDWSRRYSAHLREQRRRSYR